MCFGCSKNDPIDTVLLSTHNKCFGWELRKYFSVTHLSGSLCPLSISTVFEPPFSGGKVCSDGRWCNTRQSYQVCEFKPHIWQKYFSICPVNLHWFLILCSWKALFFVKLYFLTSNVYLIFTCIHNAPIATKVVCFSRLLKCLRSLYGKQCGPRSDCSYRGSLFWVYAVCFYT